MDQKSPLDTDIATAAPLDIEKIEERLTKGEYFLLQGHFTDGSEIFEEIEALIEDSLPHFHYRMGLAYFEYGNEDDEALLIASRKFKMTHEIDPLDIDTLHAWGNTLVQLGETREEHHYIVSAKEKYEKALGLGRESSELYWDYGVCWYHLGVQSEEAIDLQKSLQAYERAIELGDHFPLEFWVDFGATALLLATKVRDPSLIVKAVNGFKHAVSLDENSFDSWCCLAEALEMLHDHTHDEDHFSQANECFAKAAKLSPQDGDHWFQWAKFLLKSAKQARDVKRLRLCLEKCHHAYACDSENGQTLAIWAEGLALLGQLTEQLDLIYEAENKIAEAIELDENDPEIWYSLGMCFHSFGAYFNDHDYYYQAIEKFQTGLSIDRSLDHLWQAMGNTYAIVGVLEDNLDVVVQSLKFYEKAIAFSSTSAQHVDYARTLSKLGELTHDQKWLEQALYHFEIALGKQRNAVYLHPEWLFAYASTIDMLGDFHDDDKYYTRAIEIFSHVLMVDPDFPQVHHRLAQSFCHLGELIYDVDQFYRAIHHLRLALKHDEDNDHIILDWGIALINIAHHTPVLTDVDQLMDDAKQKLTLAAKLGNIQAYYYLSCVHSIMRQYDQSIYFLMKADHFHALPPAEELLNDEWLDGLRCTSEFQEFMLQHPHLTEDK